MTYLLMFPPRSICIHNQHLPEEEFPVLLCDPAYINSVQGMQGLSGDEGKRETVEWKNGASRRTPLLDSLWLTANGTVQSTALIYESAALQSVTAM